MAQKKKVEIITEAKPHTIKKFELIEKYVDEWARKVLGYKGFPGKPQSKGVVFIDCMCNSGLYHTENGNVVEGTALRVAKRLNSIITDYPGKKAILIFNDLIPERVDRLEEEITKAALDNITVSFQRGDCNDFLNGLNLEAFDQYHTLLVYDPYNAAINWSAITPFLNRWGEVIINHMSSDTIRGISQAKKQEVVDRYEETYQRAISALIDDKEELDQEKLDRIIESIIRNNISKEQRKYFISFATFYSRTNGRIYSLVHCSGSVAGIKLFKKITWKTFGDQSSLKNRHGLEGQLKFDFVGNGMLDTETDEQCYNVHDIARYVCEKYKEYGTIELETIYADLDTHPIFPSDGYKDKLRKELAQTYGVKFPGSNKAHFPMQ